MRIVVIILVLSGMVYAAGSPAYDIRHYELLIQPDFTARTVAVNATVDIDNPGLARSFQFELSNQFSTVNVSAEGHAAAIERGSGMVTVTPDSARKHTWLKFDLAGLTGKSQGEDRLVIDGTTLFLLWSDQFYPTDFDGWATVRTTVVLPEGFKVYAPGRLASTKRASGMVRWTFETQRPTVSFSIFADSRWIESTREINGIRMRTLLYPESQRYADQLFTGSADVLKFYSDTFGAYPFDEFTFFTMSGTYARRAFVGAVGYEPHYLERELTSTGHDAHETALLWWCYTTHGSGPGSWQWTEGLGDYAEIMYDEARHKPVASIFGRFRQKYLAAAARDVRYRELKGNTPQEFVHGKYPWIMAALREEIGDETFSRGLKELFRKFRYRTFTMDEFIGVFEQVSNRSLKSWRDEWLERPGLPPRKVEFRTRIQEVLPK